MHDRKQLGRLWRWVVGLTVLAAVAASAGCCHCGSRSSSDSAKTVSAAPKTAALKPGTTTAATTDAQAAPAAEPRSPAEVAVRDVQRALEAREQDPAQAAAPLHPAEFFAKELEPRLEKLGAEGLVLQRDGTVLYSANPAWIGRNLLTDPATAAHPETRASVPFIGLTIAGRLTRPFPARGTDGLTPRLYEWWTVGVHGTEWRVGALRPAPAKGAGK